MGWVGLGWGEGRGLMESLSDLKKYEREQTILGKAFELREQQVQRIFCVRTFNGHGELQGASVARTGK